MAKVWLRYDGPGHTLTISDKLILGLGSAAPVDKDLAQLLLESPDIYGTVTEIDGPASADPSWPKGHDALDALAEKFGLTFPDPVAPKKKLSVEDKVAALEAAGHTPADAENLNAKE